ncbi:MAG: ATP cone domain-containing protein [Caldilineaceae bacterium]
MRCPHCGHEDHKVVDTRDAGDAIRRRRECRNCGQRFTSYEHAAPSLLVIKRDGRREPFDRQKLLSGIRIAAVKRPISSDTVDGIVHHVEDRLHSMGRPRRSEEQRHRQSGARRTGRYRSGRLHPLPASTSTSATWPRSALSWIG